MGKYRRLAANRRERVFDQRGMRHSLESGRPPETQTTGPSRIELCCFERRAPPTSLRPTTGMQHTVANAAAILEGQSNPDEDRRPAQVWSRRTSAWRDRNSFQYNRPRETISDVSLSTCQTSDKTSETPVENRCGCRATVGNSASNLDPERLPPCPSSPLRAGSSIL